LPSASKVDGKWVKVVIPEKYLTKGYHFHIQPSWKIVIVLEPQGDAGVTGRKIV
jgi:S-adenosylmethionine synthetase